jgi:hypothetical protein
MFVPSPNASGEKIPQRSSRIDALNPRPPLHLPLLHTLVEERAGGEEAPFSIRVHGGRLFSQLCQDASPGIVHAIHLLL